MKFLLRRLIDAASRRGKWIDQSQAYTIFIQSTSGKVLSETYMYAWEMGLKTTYYLRSMGASQIEKSTLSTKVYGYTQSRQHNDLSSVTTNKAFDENEFNLDPSKACKIHDPECESCQ